MTGGNLRTNDVASASLVPISAPRSQTPDDVQKWLQDNLSKTMQVQPGRVSVVGGGQGQLKDGRRIGEAVLHDSDGELKLFVIERTSALSDVEPIEGHSSYSGGTINDVNCILWSNQGNEYILAGDRPIDQLCRVADALSAH
jgi:hypothetical protein